MHVFPVATAAFKTIRLITAGSSTSVSYKIGTNAVYGQFIIKRTLSYFTTITYQITQHSRYHVYMPYFR